jgi:hypothetical protein
VSKPGKSASVSTPSGSARASTLSVSGADDTGAEQPAAADDKPSVAHARLK